MPVIALLASSALLGAACDEDDDKRPAVRIDRATAGPVPRPLPATGPPTGGFRQAWRVGVKAPAGGPTPKIEYVSGQVGVFSSRGLEMRDARTGAARWHYGERDRMVKHYAVSGNAVVVTTASTSTSASEPPRSTGLDAVSGRTLWTMDRLAPIDARDDPQNQRVRAISAGVLLMRAGTSAREIVGHRCPDRPRTVEVAGGPGRGRLLDLRAAGRRQPPRVRRELLDRGWRRLGQAPVRPGPGDRDDPLEQVAAARRFPRGPDPEGRHAAHRPRQAPGGPRGSLITADGREVLKSSRARGHTNTLAVAGERAMVAYQDGGLTDGATRSWAGFVNLRTGKLDKRVRAPGFDELSDSGDRAYGRPYGFVRSGSLDAVKPIVAPEPLTIVEPARLRFTTVPLPFADLGLDKALRGPTLAMGGERIYRLHAAGGGLRVTAYAPAGAREPVQLGGVRPGDWPDACRLLKGIKGLDGASQSPDSTDIDGIPIKNNRCRFAGAAGSVTVAWVARTPQDADALIEPDRTVARPETGLGDEAYRVPGEITGEEGVVIRVGRTVVVVEDVQPGSAGRAVTAPIAKNLSAH